MRQERQWRENRDVFEELASEREIESFAECRSKIMEAAANSEQRDLKKTFQMKYQCKSLPLHPARPGGLDEPGRERWSLHSIFECTLRCNRKTEFKPLTETTLYPPRGGKEWEVGRG